ncbi:hypothetical protein NDU88_002731 [Pleurodeles waltl]|uniref:Uncharacterized protein n=1 Tax=Pleurodeles waltl TaxID=8319 RepID=A0AAV7KSX1_PLEWA|nr:hypothetical protein NDU88_002731 [Pleurodeles waltl]
MVQLTEWLLMKVPPIEQPSSTTDVLIDDKDTAKINLDVEDAADAMVVVVADKYIIAFNGFAVMCDM